MSQKRIVQILCINESGEAFFAKYQGCDLGLIFYKDVNNQFSFFRRSEKPAAIRWAEKIVNKNKFKTVTIIERVVR